MTIGENNGYAGRPIVCNKLRSSDFSNGVRGSFLRRRLQAGFLFEKILKNIHYDPSNADIDIGKVDSNAMGKQHVRHECSRT